MLPDPLEDDLKDAGKICFLNRFLNADSSMVLLSCLSSLVFSFFELFASI